MRLAEAARTVRIPDEQPVTWRPLEKQQLERDTLFLLDPDYEQQQAPFHNGFNPDGPAEIWTPGAPVQVVDGKFRKGLRPVTTGSPGRGELFIPGEFLPADQFLVELWLSANVPWSELSDIGPLAIGGNAGNASISLYLNGGQLQLTAAQSWDSPAVNVVLSDSLTGDDVEADVFAEIAVALAADGTLTLIRGGKVRASAAFARPGRFSERGGYGIQLFGRGYHDGPPVQFVTLSDLRISRKHRGLGETITVPGRAQLTVDPSTPTGGTIEAKLPGILHTLAGQGTEAMAAGRVRTVRTANLIGATPIKAGAVDGTHPALGHSGAYSYDWQVVDRTLAYIVDELGCEPYLSIDSCPQILGGAVAPFSGTDLTTKRCYWQPYAPQRPSDFAEFAKIAADLVYHVTVELGYDVPRWGLWNEPEGGEFWEGTDDADRRAAYIALYAAVAPAVKAIDPTLKIGGPETSTANPTWADDLIAYCAANAVPLDFVSFHWYSADVAECAWFRQQIERSRAAHGFAGELELLNGEWGIGPAALNFMNGMLSAGTYPIGNVPQGDYAAAFFARCFIEMQRAGCVRAIATTPVHDVDDATYGSQNYIYGGALMNNTHPWAPLNVYELWSMLSPTIIEHTLTENAPWLDALASKAGGTIDVFLACQDWRKQRGEIVEITVDVADGTPVTVYVVDDAHSSYLDAGPAHANLESYAGDPVTDGSTLVRLRPRSAALVRIG